MITKEFLNRITEENLQKRRNLGDLQPRVAYRVLALELVQSKYGGSSPVATLQSAGDKQPFQVYLPKRFAFTESDLADGFDANMKLMYNGRKPGTNVYDVEFV